MALYSVDNQAVSTDFRSYLRRMNNGSAVSGKLRHRSDVDDCAVGCIRLSGQVCCG
ncbi:unnamed protein product [Wuchereria bancrofti]|uniref:Uncharacterized protein n=1 Tax=Wuchereria bancrofti TaxID=6293 RepID=A0A3P7FUL1_WUCBA|nr:unnamed protein product [Wuchereria bancrofti]